MLYKKVVVCNDWHIPFHDPKLYQLFKIFLKDFSPDLLIINGDFLDCWEISKYDRVPRTGERFEEEIKQGRKVLRELRGILPESDIWLLEGNHDFRLRTYIIRKAPELYGIEGLSLPELLHLQEYKVKWFGIKEGANKFIDNYVKLGELYVGHFDKVNQHAGYTAKNLVERKNGSVLQGHVHRYGVSAKRTIDGTQLVGVENFCMCNLQPNYTNDVNWQQGWSVIYLKEKSGRFHLYPIHVIGYKFFWGNREYKLPDDK